VQQSQVAVSGCGAWGKNLVHNFSDGPSGLRVLKVLQAAQRSLIMNGEPVQLPLETFSTPATQVIV